MKVKSLSRVRLLETPWTAAYQAPPSMGFSRQEYWSGVPLPSPTSVEKFLNIIVDLSISLFSCFQFLFHVVETLLLGACTFSTLVSS